VPEQGCTLPLYLDRVFGQLDFLFLAWYVIAKLSVYTGFVKCRNSLAGVLQIHRYLAEEKPINP